jgi:hypothetical protein
MDVRNELTEITNCVENYRYGQFVARDKRHKLSMAAALCTAFRTAPVVFVVASREEVEQVAAELEVRLQEPIHRAYGDGATAARRIVVAMYVAARGEGLRDAPFIVVPNWRPGFPDWMKQLIWSPWLERVYFLRTTAEKLSTTDQDALFGRLGPGLLCPPSEPHTSHCFSVFLFGGKPAVRHAERPAERHAADLLNKRKLYWRHGRRNQALAAMAQALNPDAGAIALMVETTEHANMLSAVLPGWPIVTNSTPVKNELPPRTIITLTAAKKSQQFRPGQLVWAAGGPPSEWLSGWLKDMAAVGHAVHVFDVGDAFDLTATRWAAARQSSYKRAGCHYRPLPNAVIKYTGRVLRQSQRQEKASRTSSRARR